jgi:hypothetical protein
MLILRMNLSDFNVRAVLESAAKTEQKLLSLRGTKAWLYHILHEGAIAPCEGTFGSAGWQNDGLTISKDQAYNSYEDFSKRQHDWRPETKSVWSKNIHAVLGPIVEDTRQTIGSSRVRSFRFAPLADCRCQFASHLVVPVLEWPEAGNEPVGAAPCHQALNGSRS